MNKTCFFKPPSAVWFFQSDFFLNSCNI
jgi:hypothetical protein